MDIPDVIGAFETVTSQTGSYSICVVQESCPYMEKMDMCMMHIGNPADTEAVGCRPAKADICPPNAQKRKLLRTRITSANYGTVSLRLLAFCETWKQIFPDSKIEVFDTKSGN